MHVSKVNTPVRRTKEWKIGRRAQDERVYGLNIPILRNTLGEQARGAKLIWDLVVAVHLIKVRNTPLTSIGIIKLGRTVHSQHIRTIAYIITTISYVWNSD